jgi:hypothetical protein
VTLVRALAAILRLEEDREMTADEVDRLLAMPEGRRFYRPVRRTETGWMCRRVDLAARDESDSRVA